MCGGDRDGVVTTLRIGAIGCGDIAERRHFPDLRALGDEVELAAIQGRRRDAVEACAARFGVPRAETDPAAIIDDPSIDAVLVLTPPDSHFEQAAAAIAAGKHVLVEKPLVRRAAQARALLAAAERQHAAKPVTCFPLPHVESAELAIVRRLVAAGAIGEVTAVEAYRGHRGPTHAGWFYDRARAGGGVLIDLGIYQLTTIVALLGPAVAMNASCARFFATRGLDDGSIVTPDVEDSAMLTLTLGTGVNAMMHASWNDSTTHRETRARMLVIGREGFVRFGAAGSAVHLFRADGDYRFLPASEPAHSEDLTCRRVLPDSSLPPRSIVGAFIDRVRAGDTGTRLLAMQAHVLEIVERAYQAEGTLIALASRF